MNPSSRSTQAPTSPAAGGLTDGAEAAFHLLRTLFTAAPILFGADKFLNLMTDWEDYLAPWVNDLVPGSAHEAMLVVGVVEIVAGLVVVVAPRYGGILVAAWLGGIILNLVTMGDYYDIALRDFGLLLGSLPLARLAGAGPPGRESIAPRWSRGAICCARVRRRSRPRTGRPPASASRRCSRRATAPRH